MTAASETATTGQSSSKMSLLLGALGVVFGDIGTSPIYAFRQSLQAAGGPVDEAMVLGVLSLMVWSIIIVVTIKYVLLVMRADNAGEGGIMALLSLALPLAGPYKGVLMVIGLVGASLFFGDATITPAISVLSAVEGLHTATPAVSSYVVPIAAVILVALFAIQSRGSGRIGFLFGPVMAVWFVTLAVIGLVHLLQAPRVFGAIDPRFALAYVVHAGFFKTFDVLGSVFLALTGAEALYADMGHFGRPAIRLAWFIVVLPALVLVYLGQGALVLGSADAAKDPFFLLFPGWMLIGVVLLTTVATIIASQAVISGAFAMVEQAIQLGAVPRLVIKQTSSEGSGQCYLPQINWLLAAVVLALVFGFRSSDALANAYGIAVSGNMAVTTLLVAVVAVAGWRWPPALILPAIGLLLLVDLTFLAANAHKIAGGGWVAILVASVILVLMLVWRHGRSVIFERRDQEAVGLDRFINSLSGPDAPVRTKGTAVYLTRETEIVPAALALNVAHNGVVHERVVLMKVTTEHMPRVGESARLRLQPLREGFLLAWLVFGFAETPDLIGALKRHREELDWDPETASFFIGREAPIPSLRPDLSAWQEHLYAFMARNAVAAPDYFRIPPPRVIELGTRVEM